MPATLDCPRCRTRLPAQAAFCPHCGADVTGIAHLPPPPPAARRASGGISGRRIVLFLFALIVLLFGTLSVLLYALHKPAVLPPPPRDPNRPMFSR